MWVIVKVTDVGAGMRDAIVYTGVVSNEIEMRFNYSGMYEVSTWGVDADGIVLGRKVHNISIPNGSLNVIKEVIKKEYVTIKSDDMLGAINNVALDGDIKVDIHAADVKNVELHGDIENESTGSDIKGI